MHVLALYIPPLLALLWVGAGWRMTARIYRGMHWSMVRGALGFFRATRQGAVLATVLACGTAAGWGLWHAGWPNGQHYLAPFVIATIATFLRSIQPPVVLLLTGSSSRSATLLTRINWLIGPLRCVALLDHRRIGYLRRWQSFNDNLRTTDPLIWKSVVHRLIRFVPIVVIDTRGDADAVKLETLLMLDPRRAERAVFIAAENHRGPALEAHGIDPRGHALRLYTEQELLRKIANLIHETSASLIQSLDLSHTPTAFKKEDFDELPTMLVVVSINSFDSEAIVSQACSSDRMLVDLWTSKTHYTKESAQRGLELIWEFVHETSLALIVFEESDHLMIRVDFLRKVARALRRYVAVSPRGPLTFEQLDQPEPIWQASDGFASELIHLAQQQGYAVRFVRH